MSKRTKRTVRFAWFEYQHPGDGIMFDRGMRRLGAKNILTGLPLKAGSRSQREQAGQPELDIRVLSFGGVQGTLGRPSDAEADFLGQWLFNPGLSAGKLTTAATPTQANIIVFSGHGAVGDVWGDNHPNGDNNTIELAEQVKKNAPLARSGRMKYLFIPSCFNVAEFNNENWLPAFSMAKPLHGVFGYEDSYTGGPVGAEVMRRFTTSLGAKLDTPIVELWGAANEAVSRKQPWAALCHPSALSNTYRELRDDLLTDLPPSPTATMVSRTHPGGKTIGTVTLVFSTSWVSGGTLIDETNNQASNSSVGLFAGQPGALRIRAHDPSQPFKKGDVVRVLVYHYRDSKPDMKIDKLLTFDASLLRNDPAVGGPIVKLLTDANPVKGAANGNIDGVEIRIAADTRQLDLPFTVNANSTSHYPADGPSNTHGRFPLAIFPPNVDTNQTSQRVYMYTHAALLRT